MEFPRLLSGVLALALLASACGDDTVSAVAASEQEPAAAVASEEPTATPAPAASEPPPATATPAPTPAPEPTTTPAPEVEDAAAPVVPADCIRLTDFDDADGWRIVNDGVMGGLSDGRASVADGVLVFDGPGSDADEQTFRDIYGRSLTADDTMHKQAAL